MKKYRVHIYAIYRVPVGVEAENEVEAIKKAEAEADLSNSRMPSDAEYADDVDGFLVDTLNEQGLYTESNGFNKHLIRRGL